MTREKAKAAFLAETPVQHGGIVYEKITAITYRIKKGVVVVSLELKDRRTNSVSIVAPERTEIA